MTEDAGREAKKAWKSRSDGFDIRPSSVATLAANARVRSTLSRMATLLVAIATFGFAIYLLPTRGVAALPWILIGAAAATEWWKRRSPRAMASLTTVDFMRQELRRDIGDCLRLAGWRGYALLLGVMWLVIGSRIIADGAAEAFAARGIVESLAIAIAAPVVLSAVIHAVWSRHLRGKAGAMRRELEYVELIGR
jgi:hypothetical protein